MRLEIITTAALLCLSGVFAADISKNVKSTRQSIKKFDAAVYEKLAVTKEHENVNFSPISAHFILTLLAKGAANATFDELNEFLGLDNDVDAVLSGYEESLMKKFRNIENATLNVSNRIYVKDFSSIKETFLDAVNYADNCALAKLNSNSNTAVSEINNWVKGATNKKIENLVKEDDIDDTTQMILLNAIYFKGEWAQKFDKTLTSSRFFYGAQSAKEIDFMEVTGKFIYGKIVELNKADYIELPYTNEKLKMIVIMPRNASDLLKTEKFYKNNFNSDNIHDDSSEIELKMPKFKIESEIDLKRIMTDLNVNRVFNAKESELAGITDNKLFVSNIKQKAFIEVNEEGSEASAATDVGLSDRFGTTTYRLKINRPFFYAIEYDGHTLFEGHYVNP